VYIPKLNYWVKRHITEKSYGIVFGLEEEIVRIRTTAKFRKNMLQGNNNTTERDARLWLVLCLLTLFFGLLLFNFPS